MNDPHTTLRESHSFAPEIELTVAFWSEGIKESSLPKNNSIMMTKEEVANL